MNIPHSTPPYNLPETTVETCLFHHHRLPWGPSLTKPEPTPNHHGPALKSRNDSNESFSTTAANPRGQNKASPPASLSVAQPPWLRPPRRSNNSTTFSGQPPLAEPFFLSRSAPPPLNNFFPESTMMQFWLGFSVEWCSGSIWVCGFRRLHDDSCCLFLWNDGFRKGFKEEAMV